ncbi:hypothetical protein QR680_013710 [Steinernema hermaphroditum]|uniref:Uncharacterized protein n=1 Tax=Steinernema hermaphroditum TaxID=289476 RepID=A0AA39M2U0_9BILA|nr:hypothetical protein QR680_013710 [Steinernema hermaphroditum]
MPEFFRNSDALLPIKADVYDQDAQSLMVSRKNRVAVKREMRKTKRKISETVQEIVDHKALLQEFKRAVEEKKRSVEWHRQYYKTVIALTEVMFFGWLLFVLCHYFFITY